MFFSWKGGIRLIDEDVSRRTIAVSIKATKLTGRVLAQACLAVGRKIKKTYRARQTPHGKQTVRQLMGHGAATNSIEVESPKDFDRVARKYGIDYSLKKVEQEGKSEYLVFFKAKDVDVMTAAFKEYTSETLKKQKRESVRQKLEKVKEELSNHRQLKKEKKREQEPIR
mgnify:CR=1 FL=1